jgi:hypothetical protein
MEMWKILAFIVLMCGTAWAQQCPDYLTTVPFDSPKCITIEGSLAYVGDLNTLRIIDLSDPQVPAQISSITLSDRIEDIFIQGEYAFCAVYNAGLEIVKVASPQTPQVVGRLATGGQAYGATVSTNIAYVCATSGGLVVADVTDKAHPKEIYRFADVAAFEAVIEGSYLFIAAQELVIFSISNPNVPQLLSRTGTGGRDVRIQGNFAFTPGWSVPLVIIDISDKAFPRIVGKANDGSEGKYWDTIEVRGDMAYVAGNPGMRVYDMQEKSDPFMVGRGQAAGYSDLGKSGSYLYTCAGYVHQGIEVYDVTSCTHDTAAPVAAFSWEPLQPIVGEKVVFRDESVPFATTLHWDFGDGVTFDSDPDSSCIECPVHPYFSAGTFNVTLTASNPAGSASITKSIQVLPGPAAPDITNAGGRRAIIPAASHAPGAFGTQWVSDLEIVNHSTTEARANIYFLPGGADNSGNQGVAVAVPASQALRIEDIVRRMFGVEEAGGALIVGSDAPLRLSSRTYSTGGGEGTYGQFVPAVAEANALVKDESGIIQQLAWNTSYRTNIGFANMGSAHISVGVTLYTSEGWSASKTYDVEPYGWTQASLQGLMDEMAGGAGIDRLEDGYIVVSSSDPGARYAAYASVVDNRTGDAIFIPAQKVE